MNTISIAPARSLKIRNIYTIKERSILLKGCWEGGFGTMVRVADL